MASLDELKQNIMNVIQLDDYKMEDLVQVLSPLADFLEQPVFKNNIDDIVSVVTKDRDGNQKFDMGDLQMMAKDIGAISSLITSLFLLIGAIPQIKLDYKPGDTEEIVFKVLAYVFLVIIPKQTGQQWTLEEKQQVVNITLSVYEMIKSSQLVQDLVNKVKKWLQSKGWCKCMVGGDNPAVDDKLPKVKVALQDAMNNVRDKSALVKEIKELKSRMV